MKKTTNTTKKNQKQIIEIRSASTFGGEEFTPVELKPIKPKDKLVLPRFCVLDIESYKWTNFVVGGMYFKTKKGEQYKTFDNMYDYMVECFRVSRIFKIRDFVAHFGGKFDFLFFLSVLAPDPLFVIKNMIPRSSSILSITVALNPHVAIKRGITYTEDEITFRDSSALLTASLGSLTKTFGVESLKGELDFAFVKQIYDNVDYFDDLFNTDSIIVFHGKNYKQVFHAKDYRNQGKRNSIRYWNLERYPLFPRAKTRSNRHKLAPYKVKSDWAEEITYPLFNRNDLMKYLYHDCKGLYQCLETFFSWGLVGKTKKTWTIAGQAVNVFRLFLDSPLYSLPDNDKYTDGNVDAFVREAYFGGRTEVFKPIFDSKIMNKEWLFYYDVNSLYPSQMLKKYPNKFKKRAYGAKEYNPKVFGVWKVRVRVPDMYMPPLPVKHNNKLIFPTGEFTGQWCIYELEYAKSLGVEVLEYIEGVEFEDGGYIFKTFINSLYSLRLDAKKKKDKVTDTMTKLIMNSTYGRMGISKEKNNLVFDVGQEEPIRLVTELEVNGINLRLAEKKAEMDDAFSNVAIAAHVTCYARVHLHQEAVKLGPNHVYYCDTDSLFSDKMMETGKELGMMKLEYKCKSACFLMPKTYANEEIFEEDGSIKSLKLVMKGFDYKKIVNKFTVPDFIEFLRGDMNKIFVTETPRFATFKTALRLGGFTMMKNDPKVVEARDMAKEEDYLRKTGKKKKFVKDEYLVPVKRLSSFYDKRIIVEDGFETVPIKLT